MELECFRWREPLYTRGVYRVLCGSILYHIKAPSHLCIHYLFSILCDWWPCVEEAGVEESVEANGEVAWSQPIRPLQQRPYVRDTLQLTEHRGEGGGGGGGEKGREIERELKGCS